MFQDRIDAGMQLAKKLEQYKNSGAVILALPRGGVPVAYILAKELECSLQVILAKKIGHPHNKEYAIGAATLEDYFIIPHENITEEYIAGELAAIRKRLREMQRLFATTSQKENLEGKIIIIVDDGIATGNTLLVTVQLLQKSRPSKMIIAVPVASQSSVHLLRGYVTEVIALTIPEEFCGVGAYYKDFKEVTDDEVVFYLNQAIA
jgi:putative phosphoribosyl transferase